MGAAWWWGRVIVDSGGSGVGGWYAASSGQSRYIIPTVVDDDYRWRMSVHGQGQLDALACLLGFRLRKGFDFKGSIEMMTEVMAMQHDAPASIQ